MQSEMWEWLAWQTKVSIAPQVNFPNADASFDIKGQSYVQFLAYR